MKRLWFVTAAALSLSACIVGPEPVAPEPVVPGQFETQLNTPFAERELDHWWQGFDDPLLNQLIDEALDGNLDLAIAAQRLRQAKAQGRAVRSDLLPVFDGFVDSGLNTAPDGGFDTTVSTDVGGSLSFDPDIAGRNKRRIQEADARIRAAGFDIVDLERLIAQEVTLQYIELQRANARLALLDTTLELQSRTLEIVQARYDAGLSPKLDVDRAAADLAGTRSERGLLEAARSEARFALSVLSGEPPESGTIDLASDMDIAEFAGGPAAGLPADLVRRRPDVRAAEATLVAELAAIGVEEADLYPSLRLPGTISAGGDTGGANGLNLSLGALVDIPLFDGGRRAAEVDAQRAVADAALLQWQAVTLEALREVETALVRINALQSQLAELEQAVASSEAAFEQLDALYREGLASFIDVLDAQRTLISTRQRVLETRAQLAVVTAQFYTALGYSEPDLWLR